MAYKINEDLYIGNTNTQLKDLLVSDGDTLPIGAIVEFDGTEVPEGYEEITDGQWHNLTPTKGTWSILRYKKIGDIVFIEGATTSYTYSGSTDYIFTVPSEIKPSGSSLYFNCNLSGARIGRWGIDTAGQGFIDWLKNLNDGTDYKTATWVRLCATYMI